MRYEKGDVRVDDDFARFGSKSYAIDKINSVDVTTASQKSGAGAWALIIVGLGITALGTLLAMGGGGSGAVMVLLFGGAIFAAGFLSFGEPAEPTYRLLLHTSSSEVQAFSSPSLTEMSALRDAIEAAMVRRARA